MEVMRLARLQPAVETVVRMQPGRRRRRGPAVAAEHCDARGNAAALLVANVERQPRLRSLVSPSLRDDRRLHAADEVSDDETAIAVLVADVRDALAVWRPASVRSVEVA